MGEIITPAELLPASLSVIIDAAGALAAFTLVERLGGTFHRLPTRSDSKNWLSEAVGPAAADEILHHLGPGARLDVPVAKWWRCAVYFHQGDSAPVVARKLGMTERRVRQFKARLVQKGILPSRDEEPAK